MFVVVVELMAIVVCCVVLFVDCWCSCCVLRLFVDISVWLLLMCVVRCRCLLCLVVCWRVCCVLFVVRCLLVVDGVVSCSCCSLLLTFVVVA